jgi:Phage integrase family
MGNKATHGVLLKRTAHPGVYRRGAQYVAVYRHRGRQHKETATTFSEARAIKLARDAEAHEQRRGPTLRDYALRWVTGHAGSGHDTVREQTREEYHRLLATGRPRGSRTGRSGSPTSTGEDLRGDRAALVRPGPRPEPTAAVRVQRAIVLGAPKSYYGARTIPLAEELAGRLRALRPPNAEDEHLVFPNRRGRPLNPNNLRNRVLRPAVERAGVSGIGLHTLRHTCASLLIEERTSTLRLQRWMGHHAAAYTLETYGHLIDDELSRALELEDLGVRDCQT